MANFKTHVTTSSTVGAAYGVYGALHGIPIESSLVAAGLCGVAGMLPDIDSDSGVPLRELMGFASAVTPIMLVDRFAHFGLNYEQMVLAGGLSYLFVRFGIARLLMRYTVHRGMFHSIPALLIFTGMAFLICGSINLQLRYFKAGGVFLGMLSHLLLDEIYAVEWQGGRWRLKSSFGTALKLWGNDLWANFSTYGKLGVVAVLILSEPAIMERYGSLSPVVVDNVALRQRLGLAAREPLPAGSGPQSALAYDPRYGQSSLPTPGFPPPTLSIDPNLTWQYADPRLAPTAGAPQPTGRDRTIYDTARRIWERLQQ